MWHIYIYIYIHLVLSVLLSTALRDSVSCSLNFYRMSQNINQRFLGHTSLKKSSIPHDSTIWPHVKNCIIPHSSISSPSFLLRVSVLQDYSSVSAQLEKVWSLMLTLQQNLQKQLGTEYFWLCNCISCSFNLISKKYS